MKYDWKLPEDSGDNEVIQTILSARGLSRKEELDEFLSEKPLLTYDPFLMKNIEEGAQRILDAIENEQNICIYGDYDADGVCSISLLLEILKKLTDNVTYYIPSRFDEGYGLNKDAIMLIKEQGADLIVTVDCGSVSYDEVEYASQIGLDIIVTDHHNLNDKAVSCLLINPKQESCSYPERELSGCGVAFKLAQAIQRKMLKSGSSVLSKADLNSVLDLVAIATIGDIVPLTGENRTLVKYGIKTINSGRRIGLAMLIKETGLKPGEIKSDRIAYVIVPHLNAAGRILSAETGVKLLTKTDDELKELTNLLITNNNERRRIQQQTFENVASIVEKYHKEDNFIIVDAPDAHEGIAGIVAGKIKDKYNRPTILLTPIENERLKGTGRSIEGINIYEMLCTNNHLFEKFGGHANACGFTMEKKNLTTLREALLASTLKLYEDDPSRFKPQLIVDAEVVPDELNYTLAKEIEKLEPFGYKNPKPLFCMRKILAEKPAYMGQQQQHVRFNASGIKCILFQRSEEFRKYHEQGDCIDIVGHLEINRWNGNENLQFVVVDIRCYNEVYA